MHIKLILLFLILLPNCYQLFLYFFQIYLPYTGIHISILIILHVFFPILKIKYTAIISHIPPKFFINSVVKIPFSFFSFFLSHAFFNLRPWQESINHWAEIKKKNKKIKNKNKNWHVSTRVWLVANALSKFRSRWKHVRCPLFSSLKKKEKEREREREENVLFIPLFLTLEKYK